MTRGDGNGWVQCRRGHRHWGRFGAAGLLLTDGLAVLLQHRAAWTHEGDSWAVPGGARDSDEDALSAALREVREETSLDTSGLSPVGEFVDDHGGWAYTTIVMRAPTRRPAHPANPESTAVTWWTLAEVNALALHRGFAASWPMLASMIDSSDEAHRRTP